MTYELRPVILPGSDYISLHIECSTADDSDGPEFDWELIKHDSRMNVIQQTYVGRWPIFSPFLQKMQELVNEMNNQHGERHAAL